MFIAELAMQFLPAAVDQSRRDNQISGVVGISQFDEFQKRHVDRVLRRLENPDVPEYFWEGLEEAEDGQAIEVRNEHFENPPA